MEVHTLRDVISRFLSTYDNAETARAYTQTLARFADGFGADRLITTFTDDDLDTWDEQQRKRGLAPATLASHRRRMKAFWNWCVDRGYVADTPARFLKVKKRRVSMASKAMPSDVLKAMIERVGQKREYKAALRDTAILGLMATYGARRGDVAKLRMNAVNLRDGWIILTTKGDNELRLPLPPELAYHLHHWIELRQTLPAGHKFVFTTARPNQFNQHTPIHVDSISSMIKRLSKKVSGTEYGPHAIRHWFGQHQADNRIPPTLLRDLMGHSDVKITLDHYYNQDFDRMKRVLEQTDMAHDLQPSAGAPDHKSKIVHVDFTQLVG